MSRRVPAGGVRLLLHGLPLCAGWSESDAGACGGQLKDIDFRVVASLYTSRFLKSGFKNMHKPHRAPDHFSSSIQALAAASVYLNVHIDIKCCDTLEKNDVMAARPVFGASVKLVTDNPRLMHGKIVAFSSNVSAVGAYNVYQRVNHICNRTRTY